MPADFDIAIVGSGFAGSLLAMIARRAGRSVILIEKGKHPRFAIGESSTPLANLLLEELGSRYQLPAMTALAKWGTWRQNHPEVACGLKRGFSFFHHGRERAWKETADRRNQLLVAASPTDEVADTHWYRPDLDELLVREAQSLGVEFVDEVKLTGVQFSASDALLTGERSYRPFTVRCRLVVDATGPRGFLWRALGLTEQKFPTLPPTSGLYSHFHNVGRWEETHPFAETPPFPVDDAALHHVFDGGWIWVLRFNNGITSAGVAATKSLASELQFEAGAPGWERLLQRLPSIRDQFAKAQPIVPFVHAPNLSFRSCQVSGHRWVLLPSAAGFVDPLLSTGFPLTLLGVERLARIIEGHWEKPDLSKHLRRYDETTLSELDVTASLVGALYANLHDFPAFSALTLLYFSAAMYVETKRRLGSSQGTDSFLLAENPVFGPALRSILAQAHAGAGRGGRDSLVHSILGLIEPFNLARLGAPELRNWYPCRAEDLLDAVPKLGVDHARVEQLLNRCGFALGSIRDPVSPPTKQHAP